jgi:hypothetical protein
LTSVLPLKESTLKEIEGILYKRINARFKNNFSGNFWVPPALVSLNFQVISDKCLILEICATGKYG